MTEQLQLSTFIFFAKQQLKVTFYMKNSKIDSNKCSLISLYRRIRSQLHELLANFDFRLAICIFADHPWSSCSSNKFFICVKLDGMSTELFKTCVIQTTYCIAVPLLSLYTRFCPFVRWCFHLSYLSIYYRLFFLFH